MKKGANYILALKGNQGILHDDVKGFFAKAIESGFKDIQHDCYTENEAGHGRIETRSCWVLDPFLYSNCFSNLEKWDMLKRVVMVKSRREFKDKIAEDTRLYITSCT